MKITRHPQTTRTFGAPDCHNLPVADMGPAMESQSKRRPES